MSSTNFFSEIECLRIVALHQDRKLLEQLDAKWFEYHQAQKILTIWKQTEDMEISATIEHIKSSNDDRIYLSNTEVKEFYEEPQITSTFEKNVQLVRRKYRQRTLDSKLRQLQKDIYKMAPEEFEAQIVSYLKDNDYKETKNYRKVSDGLEDISKYLITIGGDIRPLFDETLPLKGTVSTIAGRSGEHKTGQALDILAMYCENNPGRKAVFFSKEMSFFEVQARLLAKKFNISPKEIIRGKKRDGTKIDLTKLSEEYAEKYNTINNNLIIIDPQEIKSSADLATILVNTEAEVWALDFIQFFALKSNSEFNQIANVIETASFCKDISQVTESYGLIVSQVKKQESNRLTVFPRLDDIEWSGFIRQISHSVAMAYWAYAHNSSYLKDVFMLSWQKVRNGELFTEIIQVIPEFSQFVYPYPPSKYMAYQKEIDRYIYH